MEVTKKYVINKTFEWEKSELICETKIYVCCSGAGVGWLLNNVLHGKTPPRGSTIPFLTEKSTPSYTIEPLLTATSLQRPHFWQTVHTLNLL